MGPVHGYKTDGTWGIAGLGEEVGSQEMCRVNRLSLGLGARKETALGGEVDGRGGVIHQRAKNIYWDQERSSPPRSLYSVVYCSAATGHAWHHIR